MAPGLEFHLVDSLGLDRSVQRLGISFMGCFGAFKGLAIARTLAVEDPSHRILVVCTELCSLHFHLDGRLDTHVANALFSDGAAAVVVGSRPRPDETPLFELIRNASLALEDSLELMTWEAADEGLVMRLSNEVPGLIEKHVKPFANELLEEALTFDNCSWALHPGGKAILQAIEQTCSLEPDQTTASWETLRDYGNMSSATFLFVLDRQRQGPQRAYTVGLGFGPGLSIEGLLLRNCIA